MADRRTKRQTKAIQNYAGRQTDIKRDKKALRNYEGRQTDRHYESRQLVTQFYTCTKKSGRRTYT
jgi:hypothetical protein